MKLFVWENPYDVRWGSSTLFVIAETEHMAREQARNTFISRFGSEPMGTDFMMLEGLSDPSWSADCPIAIAYEWEE